jgi:EmrB/QacA subfamily drug resistance transporter
MLDIQNMEKQVETGTPDVSKIKRSALIIATLNSFITPFMGSAVNIALPAIGKDLHVDAVLLSWIATAYLLAVAVSLVPFGRLADIHGRKRLFTSGVILFTFSSILCATSFSIPLLLLFRILQGIGNAMVFATGIAVLVSVYPIQERGRVLGINVAAVYIGLSAGPFLGGIITQYLTWRGVFLVPVPLSLIILFLIFWRLKAEWADARGERFDLAGSLIYSVAIVAIMLGVSLLPEIKSLWIILLGIIGLLAFIKWEMKVQQPVLNISLFKTNRVFAFSNLAALINYSSTYALTFLMSLYLQNIRAFSPQIAGLVLISQPLIMAGFSPLAGGISDRVEPRIVATLGMILTTFGLFLFTFLRPETSMAYIITALMVLGLGTALFSSPNTNAIMGSVEKRYFGIASGAIGTMRSLGMMLSMGIATVIFSILIGRTEITQNQYPFLMKSIVVAFIIFTVLCFGGVFASMVRGKVRSGVNDKRILNNLQNN